MHFKINLDDSPKISFVAHTTATKKNKRKLNRFTVLELKRKREGESVEKEESGSNSIKETRLYFIYIDVFTLLNLFINQWIFCELNSHVHFKQISKIHISHFRTRIFGAMDYYECMLACLFVSI